MNKDYVVVTTTYSYRMRYVMHKNDLRKMNSDIRPTDNELGDWACDTIVMEECEEFSQHWLGEQISDVYECDEDEMLTFFDKDNDHLSGWDREYKIQWVRNLLIKDNKDDLQT